MIFLFLLPFFATFQFWYINKFLSVMFDSKVDILLKVNYETYHGFITTVGWNLLIGIQPMYPSIIMWCCYGIYDYAERRFEIIMKRNTK